MGKIYQNITELVGNTPLLQLCNLSKKYQLSANIFGKLECFNPAGSVKDRPALQMIQKAEQDGQLKPGATIIEPTSGNTGIGLASIGAYKGYHTIFVMPETMSIERRKLLKAYGAEVVLTEGKKGMQGAVDKANELAQEIPNAWIAGQFINPNNPLSHECSTGPEIWEDTDGKVDILVAGIGTGGTISGVGAYLKRQNSNIHIVAVEPEDSPLLSKKVAGPHKLQGLGANFIPETLNQDIYDEIITITTQQAYQAVHEVAQNEGILIGISSGAAISAAIQVALKEENQDKNIVVILPDTGERYLSTPLFD